MDHDSESISPILDIFGNLLFTIFSYPENTGNSFFQFSTILEILEIEVFNILYNLGNVGFFIFSHLGNIGN